MRHGMFSRAKFLEAVKAVAKSQAEIACVLGISEAAVSLLYKTDGKPRQLSYEEAVKLADYYGIDPNAVTVEKLVPVLRMCLRNPPAEWSDHNVRRFAEDLVYGLELLRFSSSIEPSPDALDVAARALADRSRHRRAEEDI